MMHDALIGVAVLFGVSLLVSIPSFIRVTFSENTRDNIRSFLPVAVFINLIAYCTADEIGGDATAAAVSFACLFVLLKR